MRESERTIALLGSLGIIVTTLLMGLERPRPLPRVRADRPLVGRTEEAVRSGVPRRFRGIRRTTSADIERQRRAASIERFDRELVDEPWSEKLDRVVLHPLEGPLPLVGGEEGAPWHYEIDLDGAVRPTVRVLKGRAAAAPGLPVESALDAIHVMIPSASRMSPGRKRSLGDLCRWLRRRLGRRTDILLVTDLPGATVQLPDGVARETFLQEAGR